MIYNGTCFTLNTGAKIPAIGFGTWQDADAQEPSIIAALKAGYRHLDTASIYGTETAVGNAIMKSGIPREEIFITSKLWNNAHHPHDVEKALDVTLKELGVSYINLYLMHYPFSFARGDNKRPKDETTGKMKAGYVDFVDTYKAMEMCLKSGKVKAIGVSNFSKSELEHLLKKTSVIPAVHQIELHPWLQQPDFTAFHAQHGIHITQFSPFGNQNETYINGSGSGIGKLMNDPVLTNIASKHGKTGAQVALAWGIAKEHSVIPKSKTESRIRTNLEAAELKLDDEDLKAIAGIDKKLRFNDPSKRYGYEFYADLDGKQ